MSTENTTTNTLLDLNLNYPTNINLNIQSKLPIVPQENTTTIPPDPNSYNTIIKSYPEHISFTYRFNESLERVFSTFCDIRIIGEVVLKANTFSTKMNTSDIAFEGTEFGLTWKEKYEAVFKVIHVVETESFKSVAHRCIKLGNSNLDYIAIYNFYWNTCENYTLVELEICLKNKNFIPELKSVITHEDKINFCKKFDQYLKNSNRNLIQYECIQIDKDILYVWKYISNLDNLNKLGFIPDNYVWKVQGNLTTLGSNVLFYVGEKLVKEFKLKYVLLSENKIHYVFELIMNGQPNFQLKVILEELNEDSCLLIVKHKFFEYIDIGSLQSIGKRKRKALKTTKMKLESEK